MNFYDCTQGKWYREWLESGVIYDESGFAVASVVGLFGCERESGSGELEKDCEEGMIRLYV